MNTFVNNLRYAILPAQDLYKFRKTMETDGFKVKNIYPVSLTAHNLTDYNFVSRTKAPEFACLGMIIGFALGALTSTVMLLISGYTTTKFGFNLLLSNIAISAALGGLIGIIVGSTQSNTLKYLSQDPAKFEDNICAEVEITNKDMLNNLEHFVRDHGGILRIKSPLIESEPNSLANRFHYEFPSPRGTTTYF